MISTYAMPLSISKCLVIHYGVYNPHFQYDCGTSILPASDTFMDFGVRRSASGFFHDHIAIWLLKRAAD